MGGDLCPDMGDVHSSTTTCTFYIESGVTSGLKSGTVTVWAHEGTHGGSGGSLWTNTKVTKAVVTPVN